MPAGDFQRRPRTEEIRGKMGLKKTKTGIVVGPKSVVVPGGINGTFLGGSVAHRLEESQKS